MYEHMRVCIYALKYVHTDINIYNVYLFVHM